jgi:hypothetical protein
LKIQNWLFLCNSNAFILDSKQELINKGSNKSSAL